MKHFFLKLTFLAISSFNFLGCENSYKYSELKIEDLGNNQYKYVITGFKLESPGSPSLNVEPSNLSIGECKLLVMDSCYYFNNTNSPCSSAGGCLAEISAGNLGKGPHDLSIEFTATRGNKLLAALQCPNNGTHKEEINIGPSSRKDPIPTRLAIASTSLINDDFPGTKCDNLPSSPPPSPPPSPTPIPNSNSSPGTSPTPTPTPVTDTAPNAPSNLQIADGDSGLTLTWTDNSSDETSFVVARSDSGMDSYTTIGTLSSNTTSFTDSTNITNTLYDYKVGAVKSGNTAYSSVETAQASEPGSPGTLQAFAVSSQINLTWSDGNSMPWNETETIIERRIPAGAWAEIGTEGPDITTYTDSTVAGSTTYEYRAKAIRGRYESTYSNVVSITSN